MSEWNIVTLVNMTLYIGRPFDTYHKTGSLAKLLNLLQTCAAAQRSFSSREENIRSTTSSGNSC